MEPTTKCNILFPVPTTPDVRFYHWSLRYKLIHVTIFSRGFTPNNSIRVSDLVTKTNQNQSFTTLLTLEHYWNVSAITFRNQIKLIHLFTTICFRINSRLQSCPRRCLEAADIVVGFLNASLLKTIFCQYPKWSTLSTNLLSDQTVT